MTTEQIINAVGELVSNYLVENINLIPIEHRLNPESLSHIERIGASILCTKWKVGYPGGSFVQAVVDNRLTEAFGRADSVNRDCMTFYVSMMTNIGMPKSFLE
jgi:hypothetical protein